MGAFHLARLFEEQVCQHPDRDLVVYRDQRWTFGQMQERVWALAASLAHLGVEP